MTNWDRDSGNYEDPYDIIPDITTFDCSVEGYAGLCYRNDEDQHPYDCPSTAQAETGNRNIVNEGMKMDMISVTMVRKVIS